MTAVILPFKPRKPKKPKPLPVTTPVEWFTFWCEIWGLS